MSVVPLAEWEAAQRLAAAVEDDAIAARLYLTPSNGIRFGEWADAIKAYRAALLKAKEGK